MEKVAAMPIDPTPVARPKNAEPWKQISLSGIVTIVLASTVPLATGLLAMVLGLRFELALLFVFLPVQLLLGVLAGRRFSGKRGQADAILQIFVIFFAMSVVVLLVSVVWSVIERGSAAISWQFITQNNVYISGQTSLEYGGLGHAIIGTLLIVLLSTIVTVPLGIATAVYLTETTGKTRSTVRTLIQALSGLPSVVAGLFIYAMFIASGLTQYVGWAGSLALIPLMLPTVTRVAEESLLLVPQELRNGALALGSSAWKAFWLVGPYHSCATGSCSNNWRDRAAAGYNLCGKQHQPESLRRFNRNSADLPLHLHRKQLRHRRSACLGCSVCDSDLGSNSLHRRSCA